MKIIAHEKWNCLASGSKQMALSLLETEGIEAARAYIELCFNVPDLPRPLLEGEELILAYVKKKESVPTPMVCKQFSGTIKASTVGRYLANLKRFGLICLRYAPAYCSLCWSNGNEDFSFKEYCEDLILDFLQSNQSATGAEIQKIVPSRKLTRLSAIRSLEQAGAISVKHKGKHILCSILD